VVVLDLEVVAIAEDRDVLLDDAAGDVVAVGGDRARELAAEAAAQTDDAFVELSQ